MRTPETAVEVAVKRYYRRHQWLTEEKMNRLRATVRRYADLKLRTAKQKSERAAHRLKALKQEHQRLLQLNHRDLVDEEILAAKQIRIRSERAQVANSRLSVAVHPARSGFVPISRTVVR